MLVLSNERRRIRPRQPTSELTALAVDGGLQVTDFVRDADGGAWIPAGACCVASMFSDSRPTSASPPPLPQYLELIDSVPTSGSDTVSATSAFVAKPVWPWLAGVAMVLVILAAGVDWIDPRDWIDTHCPKPSEPDPSTVRNPLLDGSSGVASRTASRPHIRVTGRDATDELQAMRSELTDEQIRSLDMTYLATGQNLFASRVRISNVGTTPIFVTPDSIRLHLRDETVGVQTSTDDRFLQAAILEPGYYVEGLIIYRATATAGAAMRLGQGGISYDDPSIEVSY